MKLFGIHLHYIDNKTRCPERRQAWAWWRGWGSPFGLGLMFLARFVSKNEFVFFRLFFSRKMMAQILAEIRPPPPKLRILATSLLGIITVYYFTGINKIMSDQQQ